MNESTEIETSSTPDLLDTSVIARYLIGDAPEQAARAVVLIDSDRPLRISLIVLAELGFLLTRFYKIDRSRVVAVLVDLLSRANIEAHEIPTHLAAEALQFCASSGRTSFADAMLLATARASAGATIWTFDRSFPDLGVRLNEP
jgi:predicted nucleic acid-binding protein